MWEPDTLNPRSNSDNVPVSLQVSELSETVARLHESISAGQGALAPAVDRVSALRTRLELELQQIHLHSQSPDSLAQCLGRLVSAHSVFVSNVEAPYLPLPPPMMPRVSAVTASRPEPKEWREASGITRSAPTGAAWSGLTEAAKSVVQAADCLDAAEGNTGGGKQLITAPAPVVYVDRPPESNRTQVNARLETNATQTGQEQGEGGESEVIARAVKTVEAAAAAKETYVDWEEKLQHLLDATAPRFRCLAHAAADSQTGLRVQVGTLTHAHALQNTQGARGTDGGRGESECVRPHLLGQLHRCQATSAIRHCLCAAFCLACRAAVVGAR